jgi:hypothetical protein
MNFIIGVILFILTLRLFSWLAMRWLKRKISKATGMKDEQEFEPTAKPSRKKIIDKDKGDYVDFEELE